MAEAVTRITNEEMFDIIERANDPDDELRSVEGSKDSPLQIFRDGSVVYVVCHLSWDDSYKLAA